MNQLVKITLTDFDNATALFLNGVFIVSDKNLLNEPGSGAPVDAIASSLCEALHLNLVEVDVPEESDFYDAKERLISHGVLRVGKKPD